MKLFTVDLSIVVPTEQLQQTQDWIAKGCKQFGLETEFKTKEIASTQIDIEVAVTTKKVIKTLLKQFGVRDDEVNKLATVPSFVTSIIRQAVDYVVRGQQQNVK